LRLGSLRCRFSADVMDLAYSVDGKWLVSCDSLFVRVLDAASGEEIRSFRAQDTIICSMVLARDGTVAGTGDSPPIHLWDAAGGKRLRSFAGHANGTYFLCNTPDGRVLAGLGGDRGKNSGYQFPRDSSARVWNAVTGEQLAPFAGGLQGAISVALS